MQNKIRIDRHNQDSTNIYNPELFITAFTDASYCPHTKAWGVGIWIKDALFDAGKPQVLSRGGIGLANSLLAEAKGLEIAASTILESHNVQGRVIILQCDCSGALQKFDTSALMLAGAQYVKLKHVKGHSGQQTKRSYVNNLCDAKAGRKMAKYRSQVRQKA